MKKEAEYKQAITNTYKIKNIVSTFIVLKNNLNYTILILNIKISILYR